MFEPTSYLTLILILSMGVFVQAASGFAGGLLIIPSMLWCGYSVPEAQVSLLVATIPQNGWGLWTFRSSLHVKRVVGPGLGRLLFLPLGVWLLVALESFPMIQLRQIVGAVVLLATLATISFRPKPRERLHPVWAFIAFPISGFLQGVVGMGGPAMVFWVQAHDWDTRQSRAFLFSMYLVSIGPALVILYLFFGDRIITPALTALSAVPLLIAVTYVGLRTGDLLSRERLRSVTLILLLILGLAGIASPWLQPASAI